MEVEVREEALPEIVEPFDDGHLVVSVVGPEESFLGIDIDSLFPPIGKSHRPLTS